MTRQYTSKERVLAAYRRQYADRVPIAVPFPKAHELVGYTRVECMLDPEKALQAQLKAHELFPSDLVSVPGNPLLPETAQVAREQRGEQPVKHRLEDKAALAGMKVRDPRTSPTLRPYLDMCRRTLALFPEAYVEALQAGPWSMAVDLRGADALIYDTVDDPQFVHEVMRFCTELAIARLVALRETGVELTLGDPSASCSLISPQIFHEFVKPCYQQVVDYFKKQNTRLTLHMCGYTDPIMADMVEVGFDRIEIDGRSSLERMIEVSRKRTVIRGNILSEVWGEGTPRQMEEAVRQCIELAAPGSAYILSSGCAIPYETPLENIKTFWEAGLKYGRYQPSYHPRTWSLRGKGDDTSYKPFLAPPPTQD